MATLDDLQDWLIAIAQHTRESKEALLRSEARQRDQDARAWMGQFERRLEGAIATGIGVALGQARALAARGMSGTLEQAQNQYAMDQLSRQMAAVMLPVTQAMTALAQGLESRMRGWGGTEQNRMMGTILGGVAGWRLGGPWGALGGAVMGGPATQMLSGRGYDDRTLATAGLGAAALGYGVAGPYGAIPGLTAAVHFGGRHVEDRNRGRFGPLGDAVIKSGFDALTPGGPLTRGALDIAAGWFRPGGMMGGLGDIARGGAPRRDVTPFTPEMVDTGVTAQRIQEGMIRATAGPGAEEGGPLKPLVDIGLAIFDVLCAILIHSGGAIPPPRPAR